MSNDINTRVDPPRVELPQAQAAPAVTEKLRPEPVKPLTNEVSVQKKPDSQDLRRQMQEISEQLNRQMTRNKRDLSFSVDAVANKIVLTVKDSQGEVVRQIPSETALKLAQNLIDIKGLLQDGRT